MGWSVPSTAELCAPSCLVPCGSWAFCLSVLGSGENFHAPWAGCSSPLLLTDISALKITHLIAEAFRETSANKWGQSQLVAGEGGWILGTVWEKILRHLKSWAAAGWCGNRLLSPRCGINQDSEMWYFASSCRCYSPLLRKLRILFWETLPLTTLMIFILLSGTTALSREIAFKRRVETSASTALQEFYFSFWFFTASFTQKWIYQKNSNKKPQQNIKKPNQTKNRNKNVRVLQGEILALLICSEEKRNIFLSTHIVFVFGTKRKNSFKKGEHIVVGGKAGLLIWLFCF